MSSVVLFVYLPTGSNFSFLSQHVMVTVFTSLYSTALGYGGAFSWATCVLMPSNIYSGY